MHENQIFAFPWRLISEVERKELLLSLIQLVWNAFVAHVHCSEELKNLASKPARSKPTVAPRLATRTHVARLRRYALRTSTSSIARRMPRKQWSFFLLTYNVFWMMLLGKLLFYIHFGLVFHVVICFKDSVGKLLKQKHGWTVKMAA